MFLTAHSLIALSSTKFINGPMSLFFVNFFLHYVFDAIPHGKEGSITGGFKNPNKDVAILALIDFLFIIIILSLSAHHFKYQMTNVIFAVAGACAPDILWGLYRVTNWKIFSWADKLNDMAHKIFQTKQNSIFYFSTQIITIIIFIITFYFL